MRIFIIISIYVFIGCVNQKNVCRDLPNVTYCYYKFRIPLSLDQKTANNTKFSRDLDAAFITDFSDEKYKKEFYEKYSSGIFTFQGLVFDSNSQKNINVKYIVYTEPVSIELDYNLYLLIIADNSEYIKLACKAPKYYSKSEYERCLLSAGALEYFRNRSKIRKM